MPTMYKAIGALQAALVIMLQPSLALA